MATEKLNANGVASAGNWQVTLADIDEAIADADGFIALIEVDDDAMDLDVDDSVVVDGDTVTEIKIVVRSGTFGSVGNDQLLVDLLIGGVSQGQQSTGNLTDVEVNYTLTNAGWDVDRSASDMDGLQVRLTSKTTGMPHDPAITFDCLDVDVVYTEGGGGDPDILFQRKRTNILLRM